MATDQSEDQQTIVLCPVDYTVHDNFVQCVYVCVLGLGIVCKIDGDKLHSHIVPVHPAV